MKLFERLRTLSLKSLIGWLAAFCAGMFILFSAAESGTRGWTRSTQQEVNVTELPQFLALKRKLVERRLPAPLGKETAELVNSIQSIRLVLVTESNGSVVDAYPSRDFFIGKKINPYPVRQAERSIRDWLEEAGVAALEEANLLRIGPSERHRQITGSKGIAARIYVVYMPETQTVYAAGSETRYLLANRINKLAKNLSGLFFFGYWLLVPFWVFIDARAVRRRALLWGFFTLIMNLLGLIVYLLVKTMTPPTCSRCGRVLEEGYRLCPYCDPSQPYPCPQCGRIVQRE